MHQRQNTKHSTTGTTQDHHVFVTHGTHWVRLLAPRHMYMRFSILIGRNRSFCKIHSSLPYKEQRGKNDLLFNDYILRFGTPGKILHDQGREFENKLFTHLSNLCNIKRLRTTPYHPQRNGQVERMKRLITVMLKTLEETQKRS